MPTREEALRNRILLATKSRDLKDWLDHMAWTDVLLPAMEKERAFYQQMLVNATLGAEPSIKDYNGVIRLVTREQLAGRIQGIDFIISLIERILQKGEKALDELSETGYNI